MSRWPVALLLVLPACLEPYKPDAPSTGSSGGGSTGDDSTGDSSSSGDADSESSSGSASASGSSSTGSTGTGTSTDTSGPGPYCGDGQVDPGEECDDGDLDSMDECDVLCARSRRVFATSEAFPPNLIGGLALADGLCRQFAAKGDLPRWETYTAWLSDSKTAAKDRVFPGKGRYFRPDNVLVAHNADQFLSGQLEAPINVDEKGLPLVDVGQAWTGTLPDGSAVPGAQHCKDWTSQSLADKGHFGYVFATDSTWTHEPDPELSPNFCAAKMVLYCIEGD